MEYFFKKIPSLLYEETGKNHRYNLFEGHWQREGHNWNWNIAWKYFVQYIVNAMEFCCLKM